MDSTQHTKLCTCFAMLERNIIMWIVSLQPPWLQYLNRIQNNIKNSLAVTCLWMKRGQLTDIAECGILNQVLWYSTDDHNACIWDLYTATPHDIPPCHTLNLQKCSLRNTRKTKNISGIFEYSYFIIMTFDFQYGHWFEFKSVSMGDLCMTWLDLSVCSGLPTNPRAVWQITMAN